MPYASVALDLIDQAGINLNSFVRSSPISLRRITPVLGLKYKKLPLHNDTCGMLVPSNKGVYLIINADHSYYRRRFSTAHEIGHYVLGHDSDVTLTNEQDRWEEMQANKYASCLLMPEELIWRVHKDCYTIRDMATWLRVSPIAVAIRCRQLGYRRQEAERIRGDYFADDRFQTEPTVAEIEEGIKTPAIRNINYHSITMSESTRSKHNQDMLEKWRKLYGYE